MKKLRYISAFVFAPIGAFLIFEVCFLFDVAMRPVQDKFQGFFEASFAVFFIIYTFYIFGLILIVPIILTLLAKRKLNLASLSILGICCGGFVGLFLLSLGKAWLILGPIMGLVSGILFWTICPKSLESLDRIT